MTIGVIDWVFDIFDLPTYLCRVVWFEREEESERELFLPVPLQVSLVLLFHVRAAFLVGCERYMYVDRCIHMSFFRRSLLLFVGVGM